MLIVYWGPDNHWWWSWHRYLYAMHEFAGRHH